MALLNMAVDFRSRRFAFRGEELCKSPTAGFYKNQILPGSRGASSALYVPAGSPHDLLIPQDIELASSNVPTHDENALAFSEESSRLPLQSTGCQKNIQL
jgi:hypothetical protein